MPIYRWWFKPLVFLIMLAGDMKILSDRTQFWMIRKAVKKGVRRG